jgi:hypothetical protein
MWENISLQEAKRISRDTRKKVWNDLETSGDA